MHYVDEGSGPPVVMVHGNPTWSFYWRRMILDLRADFRAIAPDHIGMGWSDKPAHERYPFTLDRRISDLGRFIDELALEEPVALVVHDWGGAIGLGWAVQHPDQVSRIIVTNTAAFHLPGGRTLPKALALARSRPIGTAAVLGANAFVRGALRWGVEKPLDDSVAAGYLAPYDSPRNRQAVLRFVQDIPIKPSHPTYRTISDIDDQLGGLADKPMLICWGAKDFVFDDHFLTGWQERFPHANVHRFPRAGHLVLEDAGDEIMPLVGGFLR